MSFSKAGKSQQQKFLWIKDLSKIQNSKNYRPLIQSPQLIHQQPQIKITLAKTQDNKIHNNIQIQIYPQHKINRKQQPFTLMLSRQKAQRKKDKSPENYYSIRSIFDRVSKLNTEPSKQPQRLKSQESKLSIDKDENKNISFKFDQGVPPIGKKKILGYVDLKRRSSRELSYQNNKSETPAPGQYQILVNQRFPRIKFEKQIRRQYYYKSQAINHLNYYPNYRIIEKRGDLQIINFNKQTKRKPFINQFSFNKSNPALLDYSLNKIREKSLIELKKMPKKKKQTFSNCITPVDKFIPIHIHQQKIQQIK